MPKTAVDITVASHDQLEQLLLEFGFPGLESFVKCYGGFSGSNYGCTVPGGAKVLSANWPFEYS